MKTDFPVDWSATQIMPILLAIGEALAGTRLHPDKVENISGLGACIPGHTSAIKHVSGKSLGRRKGYYEITVSGPRLAGRWIFSSGDLEGVIARIAAHSPSP
jgi:hypothetical protein